MKIGPVDIRNHVFARRAMRGLDEAEVRAYLDLIADALQEAILESEELRTRIDRLESRVSEYGSLEKTLRDSLVAGERVAGERLEQAEREARIVVKHAEVDAEKIVGDARAEVARLRGAIDDLRRQRITYAERFRALLRSQSRILEASLESYDPDAPGVDRVLEEIDRGLATMGGGDAEERSDARDTPPASVREPAEPASRPDPRPAPPAEAPPEAEAPASPPIPFAPTRFPRDPSSRTGWARDRAGDEATGTPWPERSPEGGEGSEDGPSAADEEDRDPEPGNRGSVPYLGEEGLFSRTGAPGEQRSEP
jgi:cell division initiation protein